MFQNVLTKYMKLAQCNTKMLSEHTNIAQSSISRYVNGTRVPDPESGIIEKIAECLSTIIGEDIKSDISAGYDRILEELMQAAEQDRKPFPYEVFSRNFKKLVAELDLSQSELAEKLFLSPPTLSRILGGDYKTRDPEGVIEGMVSVVEEACADKVVEEKIWKFIERETGLQRGSPEMRSGIISDLLSGRFHDESEEITVSLIDLFREHDPNEYIKAYKVGPVGIPKTSWKIPTTKKYLGPEGLKKGMVDFFRATITSTATDDLIIYMNTPVAHFADNKDIYRKIMRVGWTLVLQGLRVHVIHNTNRPPLELKIGIETWLPLYMTGQVMPYYVDSSEDTLIYDVLMVSGSAALTGRAFKGAEESGEYVLTKSKKLIAEARAQAEIMKSQCKPLIQVYDQNKLDEYENMFLSNLEDEEPIRNTSISLPLETIEEDLLGSILERHNVSEETRQQVFLSRKKRRDALEKMLVHSKYEEVVTNYQLSEYMKEAVPLAVPEWVCDTPLYYTEEEWQKHWDQTEQFARDNKNYSIRYRNNPVFGNIHMHVRQNQYAIIDRYNGKELHFEFLHPLLVHSFYDFEAPIAE